MDKKLEAALNSVETSYGELVEIANSIVEPILKPINDTVDLVSASANNMPIDSLRNYMLDLQLKAFSLSEIKEKSGLKAELAEALQKEKYAISFNSLEGSAAVKDKLALVENAPEVLSATMYNLIADLLKTKLDQVHRLVDCLKSILMSRMQETKFMNVGASSEIPSTTDGRILLNE